MQKLNYNGTNTPDGYIMGSCLQVIWIFFWAYLFPVGLSETTDLDSPVLGADAVAAGVVLSPLLKFAIHAAGGGGTEH